jgi:general secretion pathway protein G
MSKVWNKRRREEGFTLIELLIVIIILAILAAIVIFAVGTTTKNASVSACNTTIKTVETALEAFKATIHSYPTGLTKLTKKTGASGPWLHTAPKIDTTGTTLPAGLKYAFAYTETATKTTYSLKVTTSGGTKTADTTAACKTA